MIFALIDAEFKCLEAVPMETTIAKLRPIFTVHSRAVYNLQFVGGQNPVTENSEC